MRTIYHSTAVRAIKALDAHTLTVNKFAEDLGDRPDKDTIVENLRKALTVAVLLEVIGVRQVHTKVTSYAVHNGVSVPVSGITNLSNGGCCIWSKTGPAYEFIETAVDDATKADMQEAMIVLKSVSDEYKTRIANKGNKGNKSRKCSKDFPIAAAFEQAGL